jgi:hypothetical protein
VAFPGIADRPFQDVAGDAALHQVVGGAGVHGLQVGLPIGLPREHDDGDSAAAGAGGAQQLDAGLPSEIVVEQSDVADLRQLEEPVLPGSRPHDGEADAVPLREQVPGKQVVVLVVLDQQDADGVVIRGGCSFHRAARQC